MGDPEKVKLSAPAKINLGLAVLGRRADGFHELATVFVKISLADRITLAEASAPGITVKCDDPAVPGDSRNLAYRAAACLQTAPPMRGARICLRKSIPAAAGLGGGSSDAAATLSGLNTLWNLQMGPAELARRAAAIGADVPFFLLPDAAALAHGRGDELEPVACPAALPLVLVKPALSISTAWAYRQLGAALTDNARATTILARHLEARDVEGLGEACFNDFEPVMLARFPVLRSIKSALNQPGVCGVSMAGSGPTMYAICRSCEVAQEVANRVRDRGWQVWVCQTWRSGGADGIG